MAVFFGLLHPLKNTKFHCEKTKRLTSILSYESIETIISITGTLGRTLLVLQFQVQLEVKQQQYHVTQEVQLQ